MNDYRRQIAALTRALVTPNAENDVQGLASDSTRMAVKMFVDGNLEKRLDKLSSQLEFLAEAFDDFEELLIEYIRSGPLTALDTSLTDGERMLAWLAERKRLTPVQLDYVACQRARHRVEFLAEAHRDAHARFQSLRRACEEADTLLLPTTIIHLNPIRTWARFETAALLDEDDEPSCDVLVFADQDETATALLELEGQALVNELAEIQPCTIRQWAESAGLASEAEVIEVCEDLAAMGLVATG